MVNRWTHRLFVALLMLACVRAGSALTIEAGSGYFTTVDTLQLDLSAFGLPFGMVDFESDPPPPPEPETPPVADTIIRRSDDATVENDGDSDVIDIELVALSLTSVSPITIATSMYDIFLYLDPTPTVVTPNLGQMTIQVDDALGRTGTASAYLDAYLELRLVNVANPANVAVLSNLPFIRLEFMTGWSTAAPPLLDEVVGPAGDPDANRHTGLAPDTYDFYLDGPFLMNWDDSGNQPLNLAVVPEPATLSLMGLGLAALAWRNRRRD